MKDDVHGKKGSGYDEICEMRRIGVNRTAAILHIIPIREKGYTEDAMLSMKNYKAVENSPKSTIQKPFPCGSWRKNTSMSELISSHNEEPFDVEIIDALCVAKNQ